MKTGPEADLHRARTALRRAACDLGVYRKGDAHTGRRPYTQAGRDALSRTREALRSLLELETALAAELNNLTANAVPAPFGCRHCGIGRREHAQRWTEAAHWHGWTQPTDAQVLARMRARRDLLKNRTAPAATDAAPTPEGINHV